MPNFEYLREPARKYGRFYFVDDFASFIDGMTQDSLLEIRNVYDQIDAHGDAYRIAAWIDDNAQQRKRDREGEFSQSVGQLIVLFDHLAKRGIQPFSTGRVEFVRAARKPDWKNLPSALNYLVDPSE